MTTHYTPQSICLRLFLNVDRFLYSKMRYRPPPEITQSARDRVEWPSCLRVRWDNHVHTPPSELLIIRHPLIVNNCVSRGYTVNGFHIQIRKAFSLASSHNSLSDHLTCSSAPPNGTPPSGSERGKSLKNKTSYGRPLTTYIQPSAALYGCSRGTGSKGIQYKYFEYRGYCILFACS